jgi:hypothetical protein
MSDASIASRASHNKKSSGSARFLQYTSIVQIYVDRTLFIVAVILAVGVSHLAAAGHTPTFPVRAIATCRGMRSLRESHREILSV